MIINVLFAGCFINGQKVSEGREVTLTEDPCLKCHCSVNKRLVCIKKACPVLQCPGEKQILLPGECCPKCREKREMMLLPGECVSKTIFELNIYLYKFI